MAGRSSASLVAHSTLDASAMGLSGLCLAHCLALPFLSTLLPLLGAVAEAEWVHILFVVMAAPVAGMAILGPGCRHRGQLALAFGATLGLGLLLFGALGPASLERVATVCGSLILAGVHALNWRQRRARLAG